MKKILFVIGLFILVSCGPSAKEIAQEREESKNEVVEEKFGDSWSDNIIGTVDYYRDETTGIYYSVVYNTYDGTIDMEIIPRNQITGNLDSKCKKFKSK